MTALTIVLYVLTFLAEAIGLALLVSEARSAGSLLKQWQDANPEKHSKSSYGQILELNPVITELLGAPRRRWIAVILIGAGIVLGFAGNMVSLAV